MMKNLFFRILFAFALLLIIILVFGCGTTHTIEENKKPKWYDFSLIKIERSKLWQGIGEVEEVGISQEKEKVLDVLASIT
jgi:hypothetical protein